MNAFRLTLKCVATGALVIGALIVLALSLMLSPLYLLLVYKGKAKIATITQIIPLGIISVLLWRIWKHDPRSETEQAYDQGILEGQVKASRLVGRIEGAKMISYPEDLRLKPVYSTKAIRASRPSAQNAVAVGELFPVIDK